MALERKKEEREGASKSEWNQLVLRKTDDYDQRIDINIATIAAEFEFSLATYINLRAPTRQNHTMISEYSHTNKYEETHELTKPMLA